MVYTGRLVVFIQSIIRGLLRGKKKKLRKLFYYKETKSLYFIFRRILIVFLLFFKIIFQINKSYKSFIFFFLNSYLVEFISIPFLIVACYISQKSERKIDVGIGPLPIVSHQYQKKAMELYGYKVETYVDQVYFITSNFDIRADLFFKKYPFLHHSLLPIFLFVFTIFRYKSLYFYFNGGALWRTRILWRLEPHFYRLAGVKTIITAYGGDVQNMSHCDNLLYKTTMSKDYPGFRMLRNGIEKRIDLWTTSGDHLLGGCDWVKYMYHWDTLVLAHFTVDTHEWKPPNFKKKNHNMVVFHAPNHVNIKGSRFIINAVEELKSEGYKIELIMKQKMKHLNIKKLMANVDVVVDQLVVGWYGMFAVEAMALGKPVLCNIDKNLENLFIFEGIIKKNNLPVIKCNYDNIKETLKQLIGKKQRLNDIGEKSRSFVMKYHSLNKMGEVFDQINKKIGVYPRKKLVKKKYEKYKKKL